MVEHSPEPAAQNTHLRLLSLIEQHPDYSQRRLAEAMGVSLGKTHYLLMALFEKGLIKAGRLTCTPSKLMYALTPAGVKQRVALTRRFLHIKEQEFVMLKSEIEQLRATLEADSRAWPNSGDNNVLNREPALPMQVVSAALTSPAARTDERLFDPATGKLK